MCHLLNVCHLLNMCHLLNRCYLLNVVDVSILNVFTCMMAIYRRKRYHALYIYAAYICDDLNVTSVDILPDEKSKSCYIILYAGRD